MTLKKASAAAATLGERGGYTVTPARRAHLARIAAYGIASRWAARAPAGRRQKAREAMLQAQREARLTVALAEARQALETAWRLREHAPPATASQVARARKALGGP